MKRKQWFFILCLFGALSTLQSQTIPETKVLIKRLPSTTVTIEGTVAIRSLEDDCRQLGIGLQVSKSGKGAMPTLFEVYYVGLQFEFVNAVCLPTKGVGTNLNENSGGIKVGSFSSSSGSPYADEIAAPDMVVQVYKKSVSSKAPVFKIKPTNADENLVFVLTKDGFKYVSGKGTLKTPSGKVYTFPKSK